MKPQKNKTLESQQNLLIAGTHFQITTIKTSQRKRSMALFLPQHGEIIIRAPLRTAQKHIDAFIVQHTQWIQKKNEQLQRNAQQLQQIDSTHHTNAQILITFLQRAHYWAGILNVEFKQLQLSRAKKRWGSCSADNCIRINVLLMKLSENLLDYVIVHELCHIVHKNHSANFWRFVESVMPDYKERRKELAKFASLL